MDAGLFRTVLSQQDACRIAPVANPSSDRAPEMPGSPPRVDNTGASAASPAWSRSPPPSYTTDSSVESLCADQHREYARDSAEERRLRRNCRLCCSLMMLCSFAMVVLMTVWWAFLYKSETSSNFGECNNVADQDSVMPQQG